MAPIRGWGTRGKRLYGTAPHRHWTTMTFLAALRCDRIDAPCLFDGPINSRKFQAYAEKALARTLQPGDIVIMDNPVSHKTKAVRAAIKAAGARQWFVPPYSPDLNPIEQAFSRIKHAMRMARKRDVEGCSCHLAKILATFTPTECANYLRNSGYDAV